MEDRLYLMLESPIPIDALPLGSLVKDYRHPTRDSFFDHSLKEKQKSWVRADKEFEDLVTGGSSQTGKSFLRRVSSNFPAIDPREIYESKLLEYRVYELSNVVTWFREIAQEAWSWFEISPQGRKVYLLTGFRTYRGEFTRRGRDAKILSLGTSLEWSKTDGFNYSTYEEVIFAVTYRTIQCQVFGPQRKASLERNLNWLTLWIERRARLNDRGKASSEGLTPLAKGSRSHELRGSGEESKVRELLPPHERRKFPAGKNASASPTLPTHQTRSLSPPHTQNNISTLQDKLQSRVSKPEAVGLTDHVQLPSTDSKNVIHDLVIEEDGSEEVVQLEADTTFDGVEYLCTWVFESPRLRPLYARAVQVATEDVFRVALDHMLRVFGDDLCSQAPGKPVEVGARFVRARAPLVAVLITRYIYSLDVKAMTLFESSEHDSTNWQRLIEERHRRLDPVDESEARSSHLDDAGQADQGRPPPWKNTETGSVEISLLDRLAFHQLQINLETFVEKQCFVRQTSWRLILAERHALWHLAMIWLSILRHDFGLLTFLSNVSLVEAAPMAKPPKNWSWIRGGILSQSSELFDNIPRASTFSAVCKDPQKYLRIPAPSYVTSFVSRLKILVRPGVSPGFQRIEWICVSSQSFRRAHSSISDLTVVSTTFIGMR